MTELWWVRRDARLADNPALLEAQADAPASAVFAWSPAIDAWPGRRIAYLAGALASLREDMGGTLAVWRGWPAEVVPAAAAAAGARVVWAQREYSPSAVREQDAVAKALGHAGIELRLIGSPYAIAPGRVVKDDGTPYQVFTPFSRAWRAHGWRQPAATADAGALRCIVPPAGTVAANLGALRAAGRAADPLAVEPPHDERSWLRRLGEFVAGDLAVYADERDRPDLDSTSRLSIPLAHGQVHPRTILAAVAAASAAGEAAASAAGEAGELAAPGTAQGSGDGRGQAGGAASFVSELAWREFHADVLHHHPSALRESLRPVLPDDAWHTGAVADADFAAWAEGRTGFPLVDAGMRELAATGTMHNRVRMVVASFLIKDLHLPWQRGADHFRRQLLDYDHAQNQLNWQWVAGTGRDAAPYFRVFNPDGQASKFDPQSAYVRRWVPELGAADYPNRIVDHARERAISLAAYQARHARTR